MYVISIYKYILFKKNLLKRPLDIQFSGQVSYLKRSTAIHEVSSTQPEHAPIMVMSNWKVCGCKEENGELNMLQELANTVDPESKKLNILFHCNFLMVALLLFSSNVHICIYI